MGEQSDTMFNINLLDNNIDTLTNLPAPIANADLILTGQRCNKYHFQYVGSFSLNINAKKIHNIKLNKYHLLQKIDDSYFSINTYFNLNQHTSIKISKNGNETKEIILDTVFDIDNKKKIINKLRNIALLI